MLIGGQYQGYRVCVRTSKTQTFVRERDAPQIPRLRSPGFPVEICGVDALHAPFFTERRTCSPVQCCVAGNPGRDDKGEGDASSHAHSLAGSA